MRRISGLVLAVLFLSLPKAFSQTTQSPVARDPQAVASMQAALAAIGGTTQATPTSIVASGTYTLVQTNPPVSYPLQVEVLGFYQFSWEYNTPDQGVVSTIVSGDTGWLETSLETDGIPVGQIPGNTLETFPALALALWANTASVSVTMVGTESLNGETVLHILVAPTLAASADPNLQNIYAQTNQRDVFLDQQTFLPVRVRYYSHPTDWRAAIPVDLALSNFKQVNGLLFPFTVTRYVGGVALATIQYQSIILNTPVNVSDFKAEFRQ
jgi:hypothetical protein